MNFIEINDIGLEELKIFRSYSERELKTYYEPDPGIFIAESPKVIKRALMAGYEPLSVLLEKGKTDGENEEILKAIGDVPIFTAPYEELVKMTGYELARGMLCAMRRKSLPSAEDICKDMNRIVVLEDVMNPTNVGAIFRSAAALGMDAVLLTKACSDPLYRRAARVSMGTVFQIPWTYIEDEVNITLHKMDYKTVSLALKEDAKDIDDPVFSSIDKLALILGTEGDGLSDKTVLNSDYKAIIPMEHGVDSLNVAAASAVAFYRFSKRN